MQNDRFDAIPIPRELSRIVQAGIQEGIREQRKLHKSKLLLRSGVTAAAALAVVCAGVLMVSNPSLAARLPLIGRIFTMVQGKVSYKGDFSDSAKVFVEEEALQGNEDAQGGEAADASGESDDGLSGKNSASPYMQTSNGLTVTVSEANCTKQALYLALCIESEEDFPADFIKTKNMEGYILDYDILYLRTESYYNVPGMGKEERKNAVANGLQTPYYIEGNFVDSKTFAGIIMVSLDADLLCADTVEENPLSEQFTYYLEISDIYGELLEYEETQARDPETGEMVSIPEPLTKHYAGTWNFEIEVNRNLEDTQTVRLNKTNEDGVGVAFVEKTAFEIRAQILLPEDVERSDYVITVLDADKKRLDTQGGNGEVFSTYGRNTDTVYVYVCDYMQFMDELKGDDQKIIDGALFGVKVDF